MSIHSRLQRILYILLKGVGSHGDDWDVLCILPGKRSDCACGFQTIHDGHPDIHQYCGVITFLMGLEEFYGDASVFCPVGRDPLHLKQIHQDFGVHFNVFRHQYMKTIKQCRLTAVATPQVCPLLDVDVMLTPNQDSSAYIIQARIADAETTYMELKGEFSVNMDK